MKTIIEVPTQPEITTPDETKTNVPERLYNPGALDHKVQLRVKSIEATEEYTRIDFLYSTPKDGWWIAIEQGAYIQAKGSDVKYAMIKAIGIPVKPNIEIYWKSTTVSYTLIFPALPKNTNTIDIIEKLGPGHYFNFFDVAYSKWMSVQHPLDLVSSNN